MNEWINWEGGECPVSYDDVVEVTLRGGHVIRHGNFATAYRWNHNLDSEDIIAYRIVSEAAPVKDSALTDDTREYTGGSVSYYSVQITNPTTADDPYTAECNDIIEALGMNYAEGNAFKAIWRSCAARKGLGKRGYVDGKYDAEKVVFFGKRMVVQNTKESSK